MLKLGAVKTLHKKPFVRNVAIMASGSIAAQVVNVATMPIVTRIYGPEAFGALGVFTSLALIIGPLATLSYPVAIILPGRDEDAARLVKLSLAVAGFFSVLVALSLAAFSDEFVRLLGIEQIGSFILLLPVAILSASSFQVAQQWVIRKQRFGLSARVAVIHSLAINIARVGGGYFQPVSGVLILIAAFAHGLRAAMIVFALRHSSISQLMSGKDKADIESAKKATGSTLKTARAYRAYPLFRMPKEVINAVSQSIPILLLARYEGAAVAGLYVLAMQVLALPSMLIGQSVGSVFYPRFAEAVRIGQNLFRLLGSATLGLAAIGAVPFGLIILFGPWLFGFAFGDDWQTSGEYARWLALWLYFGFINRPSMNAIPVLGQERFLLIWEVVSTTLRIAALVLGFLFFSNTIVAIALLSVMGAIANLVLVCWVSYITLKSKPANTNPPRSLGVDMV